MFKVYEPKVDVAVEEKCIKIEKFFLDFYGLVPKQLYIQVEREEEFAPIKNKDGANDTPLTAYRAYTARNARRVRAQGIEVGELGPETYLQVSPQLFMVEHKWEDVGKKIGEKNLKLPAFLE